jgi:hypothetical protein
MRLIFSRALAVAVSDHRQPPPVGRYQIGTVAVLFDEMLITPTYSGEKRFAFRSVMASDTSRPPWARGRRDQLPRQFFTGRIRARDARGIRPSGHTGFSWCATAP